LKGQKAPGFASPLYAPILELGDGSPMSRKDFVEKYDLCCEGLSPKRVKVPRDIFLEDISKIFGPIVNKNGYNYEFTKDPLFIEKIKTLWMGDTLKTLSTSIKVDIFRNGERINLREDGEVDELGYVCRVD